MYRHLLSMELKHPTNLVESLLKFIFLITIFLQFKSIGVANFLVVSLQVTTVILIRNELSYGKLTTKNEKYNLALLLLFSSIIILSTVLLTIENNDTQRIIYAYLRLLNIFCSIIFYWFLYQWFIKNNQFNNDIYNPINLSILLSISLVILDYYINHSNQDPNTKFELMISSNIRYIGYIIIFSCAYTTIKILSNKKIKPSIIYHIFSISFLVWLGGRGSILSLAIVSIIIATYLILKNKTSIKNILTLVFINISSIVISSPLNVFSWNGSNRFLELFGFITEDMNIDSINSLSSNRIKIWEETIHFIYQKPILGHGPEAHFFMTTIFGAQPHNFILQFLLEFGMLGASIFIIMLFFVLYHGYVLLKHSYDFLTLFTYSSILLVCIHGLVDGTLYHSPPVLLFCCFCAYIEAKYRNWKEKYI